MCMDGDALVTNLSLSLQPWIDKMTQENTSWLFSGDTLLINSGQQIFKNNNFTKTLLAEVDALWFLCNPKKWPCFGLYDNFAFAAYLGGARRDGVPVLNHDGTKRGRRKFEKMRHTYVGSAYKKSDECFIVNVTINPENQQCTWIAHGDRRALHSVDEALQKEISFVPQRAMNSYGKNYVPGDFIYHCAGIGDKDACLFNVSLLLSRHQLGQ